MVCYQQGFMEGGDHPVLWPCGQGTPSLWVATGACPRAEPWAAGPAVSLSNKP